jgi:hypothetical protein
MPFLTCDACVAILSEGFNMSKWCDQEVGVCFGRGVPVLALSDGLAPYGFIGRFQSFNLRSYAGDMELLADAIEGVLRADGRTALVMGTAETIARRADGGRSEGTRLLQELLKNQTLNARITTHNTRSATPGLATP